MAHLVAVIRAGPEVRALMLENLLQDYQAVAAKHTQYVQQVQPIAVSLQ